MKRYSTD